MDEIGLLDMSNPLHRVCLFLIFLPRIQRSLNRTRNAWNLHKVSTAGNRTPTALFELSREIAVNRGYWTGDPGDDFETASDPLYGFDGEASMPPAAEVQSDPRVRLDEPEYVSVDEQRAAGVLLNDEDELGWVREMCPNFDFEEEDGEWGIGKFNSLVFLMESKLAQCNT
jgi:hypothetical protein